MRITIDTDAATLATDAAEPVSLYSPEAFKHLSRLWLRTGWALKYSYSFTWLGRPIIQLPEDMVRMQELLYQVKPDVLIETGVAHGGSLIFYASLFEAMGKGRVIGVDIEIRPHNRKAIEEHPLAKRITLVEGSSIAPEVLTRVRQQLREGDVVLVVLDSNHTRDHVLAELRSYSAMVSPGSYLVVTDGVLSELAGVPGAPLNCAEDNPLAAAALFLREPPPFQGAEPARVFDEAATEGTRVTYWPHALLRRMPSGSP
jgi:cephalosporin hydroxylase